MERVFYDLDRKKTFSYTLGGSVFSIIGVFLIFHAKPDEFLMPWAVTLFFSAMTYLGLKQLLMPNPILIIDEIGIESKSLGIGAIKWTDIISARPISIRGNIIITLKLKSPNDYTSLLTLYQRTMNKANSIFGFDDICIPISNAKGAPVEILANIYEGIDLNQPEHLKTNEINEDN